jgi:16S rRNA (cytosine967-C5)-methyltransferase
LIESTFDHGEFVVVDYCAGNGGKTLAMASHIMQHQNVKDAEESCDTGSTVTATIIAHDIVFDRLKQLEGSLSRIGLQQAGSTVQILTTTNLTACANGQGYPESFADVVLVDAPCSSTGVLRRRPSQRFQLNEDEIRNQFPKLQLSILQEASKLVKVGGILVYATCSICACENEQVVASFEDSSSNNGYDMFWESLPFESNQDKEEQPSVKDLRRCCNLLPTRTDSSDGFFVARLIRLK